MENRKPPEPQRPEFNVNADSITECQRCGTCCKKGGPAFHLADKELLAEGKIKATSVFTIRAGEPVFDNVTGDLTVAQTDIIKIKGKENSWTCAFLGPDDTQCTIYETRPYECRVMKCWDTAKIEAAYQEDRLTRADLLSGIEGLWDFIQEHQRECSYDIIRKLLAAGDGKLIGKSLDHVLEMIKYDLAIRPMVIEKGSLEPDWIEFLLGRPLIETIGLFGLQVVKDGDTYRIDPLQK